LFDCHKKIKQTPDRLEVLGDGNQVKDFVFIDDVIDILVKYVINSKAVEGIFNVGSGKGTSIKELLEIFSNKTKFFGKVSYTGKSWVGDVQKIYADITKVKNALKWEPKINLNEGIEKTINWLNLPYKF